MGEFIISGVWAGALDVEKDKGPWHVNMAPWMETRCVWGVGANLTSSPVKSAQTLNAPIFVDGQLKVFRNTLSNDLRFFCRVGHESETYWSMLIWPPFYNNN